MRNFFGRLWTWLALLGLGVFALQGAQVRGSSGVYPSCYSYSDPSMVSMCVNSQAVQSMNMMYGGAYSAQYSNYGGMTGQWGAPQQNYYDMYPVFVSNYLNWRGAQPLGVQPNSYIPPIGMPAIENHMMWNQMFSGQAQ